MGILKEAADLAERVRAQGYDCECRDGHAFLCRPKGESRVLVRFSAGYGLKYPGLALIRAEAELKRLGILPKDRNDEAPKVRRAKERKEKVAAITEEDRQRATTVVQMIRGVLADLGGDTASNRTVLAKMAADAAGRLPGVTQFGSKGLGKSKPFDVARVGMVSMLDAGSAATPESLDRWEAVMVDVRRQLEGRDNGGQPVEPDPMTDEGIMQVHDPAEQTRQVEQAVEPDTRTKITVELEDPVALEVDRLREELKAAEEVLAEASEKLAEAHRERDENSEAFANEVAKAVKVQETLNRVNAERDELLLQRDEANRTNEKLTAQVERLVESRQRLQEGGQMVQEQRELHEAQVEAIDIPPGLPVSLQVALKYQDAELALAAYRLEVGHPERQARQIRKVDVTHVETAEGHDKTITSTTVNRILAGMIPGESYTMNELSERVGVSPSTVGYAFKVAVADGRVRQAGARKPPGMKGKASRMFQLAT